jgi:hypothetical protein
LRGISFTRHQEMRPIYLSFQFEENPISGCNTHMYLQTERNINDDYAILDCQIADKKMALGVKSFERKNQYQLSTVLLCTCCTGNKQKNMKQHMCVRCMFRICEITLRN